MCGSSRSSIVSSLRSREVRIWCLVRVYETMFLEKAMLIGPRWRVVLLLLM